MARVVQQRTSPPYLLITFVFLFLVATALAVLFYTKYDNVQEEKGKVDRLNSTLANPQQLRWPRIMKMRENYGKGGPRSAQTVVAQLSAEIDKLTESITGERTDPTEALGRVDNIHKLIRGPRRGLVDQLETFRQKQKESEDEIANLKTELENKHGETLRLQKNIQEVTDGLSAEISQLKGQINTLEGKISADHKGYQDSLKNLEEQYGQRIVELNKNVTEKVAEIETQRWEISRGIQEIKRLEKIIEVLKGPSTLTAIHPDGKVMRVLEESGICYIDIGEKERVRPGLTFAVYPETGVPEKTESKGSIVVTDVKENISICRIIVSKEDDPIRAGDIISNVAFDTLRTYKFLVVGDFDLYREGRPTEDGERIVKQLVRNFGGKVTEILSPVETDFVVMGQEPLRPSSPGEAAPPSDWDVYDAQMKSYEYYQEVARIAQEMNITILNTNRFLALTGYSPRRTLK